MLIVYRIVFARVDEAVAPLKGLCGRYQGFEMGLLRLIEK